MEFIMSQKSGERLAFLDTLPTELLHYQFLPVAHTASGNWGRIILQGLAVNGVSVTYSHFFIKEPVGLRLRSETETRALYLAMANEFNIHPAAGERLLLKEGQFNISYFPAIDTQLYFQPGEYTGFAVRFSTTWLQQFIHHFPGFERFLQYSSNGISCHLSAGSLYASPQMLDVVNHMTQTIPGSDMNSIFVELQAQLLLLLAAGTLQHQHNLPVVVSAAARARMENVKQWLLRHYDKPGKLTDIAHQFGTNEFSLKRDFRAVFGTTVFDLLRQERMKCALQLLQETDMPITHIAYKVGYSRVSHFSDAFKKMFMYSPSYLRKNGQQGR